MKKKVKKVIEVEESEIEMRPSNEIVKGLTESAKVTKASATEIRGLTKGLVSRLSEIQSLLGSSGRARGSSDHLNSLMAAISDLENQGQKLEFGMARLELEVPPAVRGGFLRPLHDELAADFFFEAAGMIAEKAAWLQPHCDLLEAVMRHEAADFLNVATEQKLNAQTDAMTAMLNHSDDAQKEKAFRALEEAAQEYAAKCKKEEEEVISRELRLKSLAEEGTQTLKKLSEAAKMASIKVRIARADLRELIEIHEPGMMY